MSAAAPDLLIGICTVRRPEGLRRTLEALDRVDRPDAWVEVLVVDNSADGSAEWVRNDPVATSFTVRYTHEPRPGLTYARNRALDEAVGSRAVVFLDDDEQPTRGWLRSMWAAHLRGPDDIVVGPVAGDLAEALPAWATETWPFRRPTFPDGTYLEHAGDGNTLVPLAAVDRPRARYDHRFALTGGQDTELFRRLARRGTRIRWAAGAQVVETIPAERMRLEFTVERFRWNAATWSYLARQDGARSVLRRLVALARDAGLGALALLAGAVLRRPTLHARGRCRLARANGTVVGLRGRLPERAIVGS